MIITKKISPIINENGERIKYILEYSVYFQTSMTTFFKEETGKLETDFYFDERLAKNSINKKLNELKKKLYIQKESHMDSRRFELVFDCKEI